MSVKSNPSTARHALGSNSSDTCWSGTLRGYADAPQTPLAAIASRETRGVNPSTAQARVMVDELVRNGLRHVVLCPGSRNAPLSFACHEAAAAGRLTMHVRVDERSAGFLAVGLAARSGLP